MIECRFSVLEIEKLCPPFLDWTISLQVEGIWRPPRNVTPRPLLRYTRPPLSFFYHVPTPASQGLHLEGNERSWGAIRLGRRIIKWEFHSDATLFPSRETLKVKHRIFDGLQPYGTANCWTIDVHKVNGCVAESKLHASFLQTFRDGGKKKKQMSDEILLQGYLLGCSVGDCKLAGDNIRRRYCRCDVGSAQWALNALWKMKPLEFSAARLTDFVCWQWPHEGTRSVESRTVNFNSV